MSAADPRADAAGIWLAAVAAVGFSGKAILIKLAYPWGVDAVTLLALRMAFSAPVFAAVGLHRARRAAALGAREHAQVAALGIVGYYGASYLDFLGLQYISAGLERLVLFLYPTLVVLLSWAVFGKRLSGRDAVAMTVTYAGIALAFAHDLRVGEDRGAVVLGTALVFASALAYAVYLIGNGRLVGRIGAGRFTALAMLWASLACIAQFLLTRPLAALDLPWQVYGLSVAMALFATVMPTFMVSAAIRRIGAERTALVGALGPVATIFLGWWALSEPISAAQLGGAALVVAGVSLVGVRRAA